MNPFKISFIFLLLVGCATTPVTDKNPISLDSQQTYSVPNDVKSQKIRKILNDNNKPILGKFLVKNNFDASAFTEAEYVKILNSERNESRIEMQDLWGKIKSREFISYPNTSVFCGFIEKDLFAFCDDSACDGVEQFVTSSNSSAIEALKSNIKTPGRCK